jgi:proton-dependent oligopeptide transporter, POT family
MFATSLPVALDNGAGVPGLAVAMILIGLGVGGVKSTVSPFIGQFELKTSPLTSGSCVLSH